MNDQAGPESVARRPLQMRREQFTFTGTTREYFGIWIVNVLLTIVTLGVYSAWAKVRRQRYFYGNTWLAGASFDYHARPVRILIGRLIVLGVLVAYNLALQFQPILGGLIAVALIFAAPWFVMRGLRFSARVTSYRNIRFDFTGNMAALSSPMCWAWHSSMAPAASWRRSPRSGCGATRSAICATATGRSNASRGSRSSMGSGGCRRWCWSAAHRADWWSVGVIIAIFSEELGRIIGIGEGKEPSPYVSPGRLLPA